MVSRARSRSLTPQAGPYTRPRAASSHPVRSHPPNSKVKSKAKAVPKPPLKPVEKKSVKSKTARPKSTPVRVPTPSTPSTTPSGPSTTPVPSKLTPAERRAAATHRRTPPPEHLFIAPPSEPPFHFSMVPPLRVPKSNAMWARDGKVDTEVYLAEVGREGRDGVEGQDKSGRSRDIGQRPNATEVIVIDSDSDDDKPAKTRPTPSLPRPESHGRPDSAEPFRYPSFSPNPSWTPTQTRALWAAMIEVGEKNKNWTVIAARVSEVGSAKSNSECRKKWEREKKKAFP